MSFLSPLSNSVELKTSHGHYHWGNGKNWILFAGMNIVEDEAIMIEVASELKAQCAKLSIPWIFKCSFDKANRQSIKSYRGPGISQAFKILEKLKTKVGCDLLTDVHEVSQVKPVAELAEVIQIPAFLCRQTDLVVAAAETGRVLNIKKAQFLAAWDMKPIVEKAIATGNSKILLCERGSMFGYNRLVVDFENLLEMRKIGFPVIMDATHAVQLPGAQGSSSGGRPQLIEPLARAAMAFGVDGLFMECHPNPQKALCDGPNCLALKEVPSLLNSLNNIWKTLTKN